MELKANFAALGQFENKKWNTKINYTTHLINFTSIKGDVYNLKFKNDIMKIYPITNGVIIKMIQSLENIAFFKHKNKQTPTSYRNYILFNHPISSMFPLENNSSPHKNYDIIKTSKRFPIILTKDKDVIKVYMIMYKNTNQSQNFEVNLKKMINSTFDPFNLGEESPSQFPSENDISLCLIGDLCGIGSDFNEKDMKIKIVTFYSNCHSLFISVLYHYQLSLYELDFTQNSKEIINYDKVIRYNGVLDYHLIDSVLHIKNEKYYQIESNHKQNNQIDNGEELSMNETEMMKTFLKEKTLNHIKNKTLCYLTNSNIISFCESGKVILNYSLIDLPFTVRYFRIDNDFTYTFSLNDLSVIKRDNNCLETKAAINLDYNLNDDCLLFYIQFVKEFYSLEVYYCLLYSFYWILNQRMREDRESQSHLEILCMILCECFNESYSSKQFAFKRYNIIINNLKNNDYSNSLFDNNSNTSGDISNNCCNSIEITDDLRNEIASCTINDNKLLLLLQFTRELYEMLKISSYRNYPNEIILLNMMINLLTISNDPNITFLNLSFLSTEYNVIINSYQLPFSFEFTDLNPLPSIFSIGNNDNEYKFSFHQRTNIQNILYHLTQRTQGSSNNRMDIDDDYTNYHIISINNEKIKDNNNKQYQLLGRSNNESRARDDICKDKTSNFLLEILLTGYSINDIKNFHPAIALTILQALAEVKGNPFDYLTNNKDLNMEILTLIDRLDLAKNIISQQEETMENLTSMLYKNETSDYDSEYYLTKIKFDSDSRIREANRILSPTRILKIESTFLNSIVDMKAIEYEKALLVQKHLVRQYSTCIGHGALNLNTIKTFPKEVLIIKQLNLQCLLTHDESTYKFDKNAENIKDKDFTQWAEFHNGVAQSLKLSTENFTNKSYIRNWILFNKPNQATFEHGGFLLGMGLLRQLDSLFSTEVYQYMKTAHAGVTSGILLGRSASKIGSMEESLSRTLCLHITFLIPSTLEINIPMAVQCSAVIGIGLLYMSTGNRLMTEMLLNQIGKFSHSDKSMDLKHIESYNLCLGFSIGLINLGLGKVNSNQDLNYDEKLLNFANGNTITLNSKLTSPSAYVALTLSYLQSNNTKIANSIKIPENLFQLDSFRPFHLYLALMTKNLILWNSIQPTIEWIMNQIPSFIKFLYENPLSVIAQDLTYTYRVNQIEFSTVSACYYYSICAAVLSIGFKYCGTSNQNIRALLTEVVNKIRKVSIVSDIIIKDNSKYNNSNKYSINKTLLDECLCICASALSLIMSGSGDLETFKTLRIIRKKVDCDSKSFTPGYPQSINHSIGMLFLGSGGLTFNYNQSSIAFLYISTFPIFINYLNDNERYLQPLRHLYVLACESKLIETRDIETNQIIQSNLKVYYNNGLIQDIITPSNIDNSSIVTHFSITNNPSYYDTQIKKEDLFPMSKVSNNKDCFNASNVSNSLMKSKQIFIKKKSSFSKEIELAIETLDLLNKRVTDAIRIVILKIKESVQIGNNKTDNSNEFKIYTDKVIEQIEFVLNENNKNLIDDNSYNRRVDVIYMKALLVLFIKYIQIDNLISFMLIDDNLSILREELKKERSIRMDVFEFFIKLKINEFKEDLTVCLLVKDIRKIIYEYILTQYKYLIKEYLLIFSKHNQESTLSINIHIPFDFIIMKILSLTNINLSTFALIANSLNDPNKNTNYSIDNLIKDTNINGHSNSKDNIIFTRIKDAMTEDNYDMIYFLINLA